MKPVKLVEGPECSSSYYGDSNIGWAFCTKPNAANESIVVNQMGYCRESLTTTMFAHMSPKTNSNSRSYKGIDKNRLRIVARIVLDGRNPDDAKEKSITKFFKGVSAGVKILNVLEERNGWQLTKIRNTVHEIHPDLVTIMLVGSSRWLKSAHMLSLLLLLVRIATRSMGQFDEKKVTDFEALDKIMKGYGRNSSRGYGLSDPNYIYTVWPYVDVLMKNYVSFFKGTNIKKNWKLGENGYYYNEGIYKLCEGGSLEGTSDKLLAKRFKDLRASMPKTKSKKA